MMSFDKAHATNSLYKPLQKADAIALPTHLMAEQSARHL
jgi:hypothetical protein